MTKTSLKLLLMGLASYFLATSIQELSFKEKSFWLTILLYAVIFSVLYYFFGRDTQDERAQEYKDERLVSIRHKAAMITLFLGFLGSSLMVMFSPFDEMVKQTLRISIIIMGLSYFVVSFYLEKTE